MNMPNVDNEHTHYACIEQMMKRQKDVACCGCTKHVCLRDRLAAASFEKAATTFYTDMPSPKDGDLSPDGQASVRLLADE